MCLGVMLIFLAWIFFLPNRITLIISVLNIAKVYWFILQGEQHNIESFWEPYGRYLEAVGS
jgi:protein-S-isoprenylcysteine O-methyltransferase Ste14